MLQYWVISFAEPVQPTAIDQILRLPPCRERSFEPPAASRGQPGWALPGVLRLRGAHPTVSLEHGPDARQCRALQPQDLGQFLDRRRAPERQGGEDRKLRRAESVRTQLLLVQVGDRPGVPARGETVAAPTSGEVDACAHTIGVYTPF